MRVVPCLPSSGFFFPLLLPESARELSFLMRCVFSDFKRPKKAPGKRGEGSREMADVVGVVPHAQLDKWYNELIYCSHAVNLYEVFQNKRTAEAVARFIREFIPHWKEQPAKICFIKKNSALSLSMSFSLHVVPKRSPTALKVVVALLMPQDFPISPPICRVQVRDNDQSSFNDFPLSGTDVPLKKFLPLKNAQFSYTLVDVLAVLKQSLENDLQYFITTDSHGCGNQFNKGMGLVSSIAQKTLRACSQLNSLTNVAGMTNETQRHLLWKQQVVQSIITWHKRYLASYFTLRKESLLIIERLRASGKQKWERVIELQNAKKKLLEISTTLQSYEDAATTFQGAPDSLEEHSKCIVPEDDLQARAFELLGEIHSSDAVLELLERSLKAGQLSCEEYVRRVSDVGRKQFEARFLFGRVTEAVSSAAADPRS